MYFNTMALVIHSTGALSSVKTGPGSGAGCKLLTTVVMTCLSRGCTSGWAKMAARLALKSSTRVGCAVAYKTELNVSGTSTTYTEGKTVRMVLARASSRLRS